MSKVLKREQLVELCTSLAVYLGVNKIENEDIQERVTRLISILALHFLEKKNTDELLNIIANICALDNRMNKGEMPTIVDNNKGLGVGVAFQVEDTMHIIGCKECFDIASKWQKREIKVTKGDC